MSPSPAARESIRAAVGNGPATSVAASGVVVSMGRFALPPAHRDRATRAHERRTRPCGDRKCSLRRLSAPRRPAPSRR